jgi:hypothetical protein
MNGMETAVLASILALKKIRILLGNLLDHVKE